MAVPCAPAAQPGAAAQPPGAAVPIWDTERQRLCDKSNRRGNASQTKLSGATRSASAS